jgi:hypothetical protein
MCSSDIKSASTNPKGAWITSGLTVIRQQLGKLGFSIRRERSLSESAKEGAHTVFKLSGRIRSGDIEGLREQMDGHTGGIILDLEEVTLVDVEVVRFFGNV